MHIHLLQPLSPPPCLAPHKPLMLLQFYNKNTFCGAFSASEFSIFAIFMIFLQVGGQGSLAIVRGEVGEGGVGVGQTTSTCLVYFAVSLALHSHSFPISPSRAACPPLGTPAAPAPAHSRMLHVAGVILILHLAFSFCLCCCCCCWVYKKVDDLLRLLLLLLLLSLLLL